jgi:hypothetical protein
MKVGIGGERLERFTSTQVALYRYTGVYASRFISLQDNMANLPILNIVQKLRIGDLGGRRLFALMKKEDGHQQNRHQSPKNDSFILVAIHLFLK